MWARKATRPMACRLTALEFLPLALCQMHVDHLVDLLLSQAAKFMPNF